MTCPFTVTDPSLATTYGMYNGTWKENVLLCFSSSLVKCLVTCSFFLSPFLWGAETSAQSWPRISGLHSDNINMPQWAPSARSGLTTLFHNPERQHRNIKGAKPHHSAVPAASTDCCAYPNILLCSSCLQATCNSPVGETGHTNHCNQIFRWQEKVEK